VNTSRVRGIVSCATRGQPFVGGLKMATPGGMICSTNITPDKETGIGNYTLEDFSRAMRQGIAKDGHRLCPAMPYPSCAKINDDDIRSLFDFFTEEVTAVSWANEPSELAWPLRPLLPSLEEVPVTWSPAVEGGTRGGG